MSDRNKQITGSFKKIEEKEIKAPCFLRFAELVSTEKRRLEKKRRRQFVLFAFLSIFIAGGVLLCLFTSLTAYAAIQALPFTAFAVIALYRRRTGVAR